jgi:hypothetical protein
MSFFSKNGDQKGRRGCLPLPAGRGRINGKGQEGENDGSIMNS